MRDRFSLLKSDLERSKGDNVKLYEKIKYVQEYTRESGAATRLGKKVGGYLRNFYEGFFLHFKDNVNGDLFSLLIYVSDL